MFHFSTLFFDFRSWSMDPALTDRNTASVNSTWHPLSPSSHSPPGKIESQIPVALTLAFPLKFVMFRYFELLQHPTIVYTQTQGKCYQVIWKKASVLIENNQTLPSTYSAESVFHISQKSYLVSGKWLSYCCTNRSTFWSYVEKKICWFDTN